MTDFIKQLESIKKNYKNIPEDELEELTAKFNYEKDKNFLLGKYADSSYVGNYFLDILIILEYLSEHELLDSSQVREIINLYKEEYKKDGSRKSYILRFIGLLGGGKDDFRELYDFNCDLGEDNKTFRYKFKELRDIPYFIKSFLNSINAKEEFHTWQYIPPNMMEFILTFDDRDFLAFFTELNPEGFLRFGACKETTAKEYIQKIRNIKSPDLNNKLRDLFFEALGGQVSHSYNKINEFSHSIFCKELIIFLKSVYTDFGLQIGQRLLKGKLYVSFWEICDFIALILDTSEVKQFCALFGKTDYSDVFTYEKIESGTRSDKKELLVEFEKWIFPKIKRRKKTIDTFEKEEAGRKLELKTEFLPNLEKDINYINEHENHISEWLIYEYDTGDYKDDIDRLHGNIVKEQTRKFFELDYTNPKNFELNFVKDSESRTSYTTNQYLVHGTFDRFLKYYIKFGFDVSLIRERIVAYLPFSYLESETMELVKQVFGDHLEKKEIEYLLFVFTDNRGKNDDLKYHNIQTFTYYVKEYIADFKKFSLDKTKSLFLSIISDKKYKGWNRLDAMKSFDFGEEKQYLEIFNTYKSSKNYFLDILGSSYDNSDEKNEFDVRITAGKYALKYAQNKLNEDVVLWFFGQLKVEVSFLEPGYYGGMMREVGGLESEISSHGRSDSSIIEVFKYFKGEKYLEKVLTLLVFSFQTRVKGEEYEIFTNYIWQGVYWFFEFQEKKNLKLLNTLKQVVEKEVSNKVKIAFYVSYYDNLLDLYLAGEKPSKILKKTKMNEKETIIETLKEKIDRQEKEISRLSKKSEIPKKREEEEMTDITESPAENIVLFVEGKYDKNYLELAWKILRDGQQMPFQVWNCYGRSMIKNMLHNDETYKNNVGTTFMGMFDFDIAFDDRRKLEKGWTSYEEDEYKCLCKKKSEKTAYAFVLPVPKETTSAKAREIFNQVCFYPSQISIKQNFDKRSHLSIELLFYDRVADDCNSFSKKRQAGGVLNHIVSLEDGKKESFYQYVLSKQSQDLFTNFEPIFALIERIIKDLKV